MMYGTVLLAYDGSREGRLALREGARLAQICNSKVVLLAVVEASFNYAFAMDAGLEGVPPEPQIDFEAILAEGAERLTRMGLTPTTRLENGPPADRITAVALEVAADLVVVGHQKKSKFARWLVGSVATTLSDSLNCSLLIGRQEVSDDLLFANSTTPQGQ